MKFDKMKSAGYLSNHMARLFAQNLQQEISSLNLAPAQFMALIELWSKDGQTQKELMQKLDVEQATMANTIIRMERDDLIVRKPHPKDKRAQLIFQTERAKAIQQDAIRCAQTVNAKAVRGLSQEDQKLFLSIIPKIINNLKISN